MLEEERDLKGKLLDLKSFKIFGIWIFIWVLMLFKITLGVGLGRSIMSKELDFLIKVWG